jgi:nucleoid-associated protein YgaU
MSLSISSRRFVALAAPFMVAPALLAAQSLRGSVSSVNRMYRQARAEDFSFFETPASVRRAVNKGLLVRLDDNADNFDIAEVGYPYVRKATLAFVDRLGAQYREGCGERLVVTSAVRPETRQPPNSTERSVHPTGMAIDLRKPSGRSCLKWLREALLGLEKLGLVEATEEHSPAHFHVAVFLTPYSDYVAARTQANAVATYVVRPGDTLWDIARDHDVTVKAIMGANSLDGATIQPGQELRIPNYG